jgi:hypothetical protein
LWDVWRNKSIQPSANDNINLVTAPCQRYAHPCNVIPTSASTPTPYLEPFRQLPSSCLQRVHHGARVAKRRARLGVRVKSRCRRRSGDCCLAYWSDFQDLQFVVCKKRVEKTRGEQVPTVCRTADEPKAQKEKKPHGQVWATASLVSSE